MNIFATSVAAFKLAWGVLLNVIWDRRTGKEWDDEQW